MDERPAGPDGSFLPPEPGGPEPDLGGGGRAEGAGQAHGSGYAPPQHAQPLPVPPATQGPPPGHGWSQPPGTWQQQPPGQPWAHAPGSVPDNGAAVAGLILSISAIALLLFSAGLSSIISVGCAGTGIFYSLKGRARVDRGETPKHRGVAQAGFVTGIVGLVLAVLATAFWTIFAILYATDEDFRHDLDDELDGDSPNGFESTVRIGAIAVRAAVALLR